MSNKLIYSSLNPLQMFLPNLSRDVRYNSRDFDDFEFSETIRHWEQPTSFCQPWQLNDNIPLQLQTNIGPVNWVLKDCKYGRIIDTVPFDQKQESENEPGLFIYEMLRSLNIYNEGCYYSEIQLGSPVVITVRSGSLDFEELHEDTMLMEYKHFENKDDMIFETGIYPCIRIPAIKKFLGSKNKSTVWEDQILNTSMLRSQKYRNWRLIMTAVPDYFSDIVAGGIGCNTLSFDGKFYTDVSDLEMVELDGFPKRGWAADMRERYTRGSKTIIDNTALNATIAVTVNVDSKGFGNSNSGSETAITDIQ